MDPGTPRQELGDADVRGILDALPDLMGVIDGTGAVRWVNARGLELCGLPPDGFEPLTIWDVVHEEDYELAKLGLSMGMPEHLRPPGHLDLRRPDGKRVRIEVHSRPVMFDGDLCVLVVGRQIDYRIEEQINELIEGQPFEHVIEKAVGQMRWRWPGYLISFSTIDASGSPMVIGDDLPAPLSALRVSDDGSLPWERAVRDSVEVYVGLDQLDVDTAAAARAFGVDSCGVAPLDDPLGSPACLVTWRRIDRTEDLDRVWLRGTEVNLIRLALVRRAGQLALELAAVTDPLTGLHNRTVLFDRLAEHASQPSGRAVLFLDLDGFKPINDTLGHGTGDRLLNLVARRLESVTRGGDLAARMGGDEFAVLASSIDTPEQAIAVAQRIVEVMDAPFEVAPGTTLTIDVSVGVAIDANSTEPADHIVDRADAAMYAAKRLPGSRYYVAAEAPSNSA